MDLHQSLEGVERANGYSCESLLAIQSGWATQNGVSVTLGQTLPLLFPYITDFLPIVSQILEP